METQRLVYNVIFPDSNVNSSNDLAIRWMDSQAHSICSKYLSVPSNVDIVLAPTLEESNII